MSARLSIVGQIRDSIVALLRNLSLSASCFIGAGAILLFAVLQAKPLGNYSFIGALLLTPAALVCAAGIAASCSQQPTSDNVPHRWLLVALACAALLHHSVTSISLLRSQAATNIDVYLFQHHAAAALLHGIDPHTLTTENIYGSSPLVYGPGMVVNGRVHIGMPYPPASLFFVLPGYLAGDIRYAYVAAVLLSAVLLLLIRTDYASVGIACLLLLNPVTRYVEGRSWTEPFVLLALTATIYAAAKKCWWLPIALGVFFASKQYSVLALPFVPMLVGERGWRSARRLLAQALGVALVLTLPLALWNVQGFWRDIVLVHLRQPFRPDALSLGNLFGPIPGWAILILVVMSIIFSTCWARPHPSMFAACFGFTFLIFVCTNKQAFCNYYFLIVQSLLLAVAALDTRLGKTSAAISIER